MNGIRRRDFLRGAAAGAGVVALAGAGSQLVSGCSAGGGEAFSEFVPFSLEEMKKLLDVGLSKGGDFSELYFEYRISGSIGMEEDIVKSSSENISLGAGFRVVKGSQIGYGYTNEMTFDSVKQAALSAAAIASSSGKGTSADLTVETPKHKLYDMALPLVKQDVKSKIELIKSAYDAAKNYDPRIVKTSSSIYDELQYVTIANSEGLLVSDVRPQTRLGVSATAEENDKRNTGYWSEGGRVGMNFFNKEKDPVQIGKRAAEEAIILLGAKNPPVGEQIVVLSKDQSGVMIHEAVGHPLEADGNWKKQSIMHDKLGQMVANEIVTIYDDATISDYRGSLNVDDEGTPTENVPLIEKGKLVGYLNDRIGAKQLNHKMNGHGRRESFRHFPIPRMNNTILAKGDKDPEEIIASVPKGFYAISYQGGMVDNTGKFTFSVNTGYMIENGKLTYPVKNATLIGTNIQILKEVDMIGNDTGFFLGTCGKEGQSVPVTCGTPTLRIRKMTVGGSV